MKTEQRPLRVGDLVRLPCSTLAMSVERVGLTNDEDYGPYAQVVWLDYHDFHRERILERVLILTDEENA